MTWLDLGSAHRLSPFALFLLVVVVVVVVILLLPLTDELERHRYTQIQKYIASYRAKHETSPTQPKANRPTIKQETIHTMAMAWSIHLSTSLSLTLSFLNF
jgi:hypothetical protein